MSEVAKSTEMPIMQITAEHVVDGQYVGPDVSAWGGHIEIAARLGWVNFSGLLNATGRIKALAGSGIKAGFSISCKWLSARLRIFAGMVNWRLPEPTECEIRGEVRSGVIALGSVVTSSTVGGV